jgi:hypothetical protein
LSSISEKMPDMAKGFLTTRFALFLGSAAGVVAVLLIASLFAPKPPEPLTGGPPNPFEKPEAGVAYIRKLARQYGSDFDRLSNDDRIFLNAIAMGHGRELLAKTARELKTNASSP